MGVRWTVRQLLIISTEVCVSSGKEHCTIFSLNMLYFETIDVIKMCLNETYSEVRIGKNPSDAFPRQKEMFYHHCFSTLI